MKATISETRIHRNFESVQPITDALVHAGQAKLLIQRALQHNCLGTKQATALSRIVDGLSCLCSALGRLEAQ